MYFSPYTDSYLQQARVKPRFTCYACNILIGTFVFRKKKNGYAVCIFIHLHAGWFKPFLRNTFVPT